MAYGNINVDTVTTSTAGGVLGAGNASIMKNRIINGAMVISQRNGTSSGTSAGYIIDRFQFALSQASKLTWQQNAGSVTLPVGFTNYLGITSSSAYSVSASDYFLLMQYIEGYNIADLGWGTANAKTVTLSFQVYSSLTGTFGGSLRNSDNSRSYPFSYTVSSANTWTTVSITISGDTSGTWVTNNGIGIKLSFGLGVGSTFSGAAGSWSGNSYFSATGATSVVGTSGATFYITGVQLEVGSSATGFEYVNYQTSLANCQRYAIRYCGENLYNFVATAYAASTTAFSAQVITPVPMRTQPTLTTSGNFLLANGGISITGFTIDTNVSSTKCLWANGTVASGLTAGQANAVIANNSASASFLLSAEL